MQRKGTKTLETTRLRLRKFRLDDSTFMFKNWANDKRVTYFLTWQPHLSEEVSRKILTEWIGNYENASFYNWAICLKESDEPIGNISIVRHSEDFTTVEMGYCIGYSFWFKGIMAEALERVIAFLFEEIGVLTVLASHDVNNPNSGRVMQKAGMKFERTIIGQTTNNQGVCDINRYIITKNDYYNG